MSTIIKADTRGKEKLIKREQIRLAKLAANVSALTTLIASLPKVNQTVVPEAVKALMDAADQYKASQPLVDTQGRRSKPTLAEARSSLTALNKHLKRARDQLSDLPVNAIATLGQTSGASVGKMKGDIDQVCQSVGRALAELAARPHKAADAARNVLAYQVAVVFKDILKKTPSCTQAKQLKEVRSRGGAAYDRVLRATLKAAGVSDYDAGPLITAGLRLLKDPVLPC